MIEYIAVARAQKIAADPNATEGDFLSAIRMVAGLPMPPATRDEINGILRELALRLPPAAAVELLDLIVPAAPLQ